MGSVIGLGCSAHLNLMHYWASFQYVHHTEHEQQQNIMKDDDLDPEDDNDNGSCCSSCKLYLIELHQPVHLANIHVSLQFLNMCNPMMMVMLMLPVAFPVMEKTCLVWSTSWMMKKMMI